MNYKLWFVAWRYLVGSTAYTSIRTMAVVCFISIFIGSCALGLVTAVMRGFEAVTHKAIQGIHATALMRSKDGDLNVPAIATVLTREFPAVVGYSPQAMNQVIMYSTIKKDQAHVVMLKAIDPILEKKTSSLAKTIQTTKGDTALERVLIARNILIGAELAKDLAVKTGDTVTVLYTPDMATDTVQDTPVVERAMVTIGGIFKTGIDDFDGSLAFCSFQLFNTLFPDAGVSQIALALDPTVQEVPLVKALRDRLALEVYTWKDLYPALVAALRLEKYAMFFIVALIVLVASMNMVSLLFMHIMQKRGDIAIFQSMGMHAFDIRMIFIIMGSLITSMSGALGLATAWFIGVMLQRYPCFKLPDAYYVTTLPICLELSTFIGIFLVILALGFIATIVPIRTIKSIAIADILRADG